MKIACAKEVSPTKSNQCGSEGADCGENQPIPDASTFVHARRGRWIGHISLLSFSSFLSSPEMTQRVRARYPPNLLKQWRRSRAAAYVATKCSNCRIAAISALTREPLSSAKRYAGNRGGFLVEPPTQPALF